MSLNIIKYWVFLVLVCVILPVMSQDSIPLSLDAAVDLGLQKNHEVVKADYNLTSSEFALKEAKGNFLPTLALSANYNRNINRQVIFLPEGFGNGGPIELGFDNQYNSSLNLSLPLYSNYNLANKKLAQTRASLQGETVRSVAQSVRNSVKRAYFNYLIAQEAAKVQQGRLNNALQMVGDIKKRLQQGTLTDYDLTSAKVQVATSKNNLLEAQSNLLPFENSLKLLLGMNAETVLKLTEPIALIEDEMIMDADVESVLQKNSILKQLQWNIELNQKQIKLTESAYYPTLDFIGNYSYLTQADDFNLSNYEWFNTSLVGLQMQFKIFNGTVTKNKVEQSRIDKKLSEEEKEYITTEYRMQFIELLSQIDFSQQKVTVQKENMALTQEALGLVKKRYEFGVGTFLEVNNAELAYTQARLNWLQSISDYKSAYYDYQLLIGQ